MIGDDDTDYVYDGQTRVFEECWFSGVESDGISSGSLFIAKSYRIGHNTIGFIVGPPNGDRKLKILFEDSYILYVPVELVFKHSRIF